MYVKYLTYNNVIKMNYYAIYYSESLIKPNYDQNVKFTKKSIFYTILIKFFYIILKFKDYHLIF